ncbi:MAG: hypothetical protein OXQ89_05030 [Rhodospirillaceae bacterium]|nr:hypothetical protein [Rhodospirillaceae bacterium]MDE0359544.1 hypothetical protein [Rhodospirillaceae bacterium]
MLRFEGVQAVLNAFAGVFTQPFEQDLKDSVRAAAVSVTLATLLAGQGLVFSPDLRGSTALEMAGSSLVLVLAWMAISAIMAKGDRRAVTMARNLSVVSFWIAVTLVLVSVAELLFPDPLARAIRLGSVWVALLILVPVHMFRNMIFGRALPMTMAIWFSSGALGRMFIY